MKALASLALFAALGSAAFAQTIFSTGFDAPTYTAGATVVGQDGWAIGSGSGSYQTVSNAVSFAGGQSLTFAPAGGSSFASVIRSFTSVANTAYTLSTKIRIAGTTSVDRTFGLYLSTTTLGNTYLGATISGAGGLRVGKTWSDTYKTTADATAAAGTFADRWLDLVLKLDGAGNGTVAFSGFSDGAVYNYSFTGVTNTSGTKYVNVGTDYLATTASPGTGSFDNLSLVSTTPVPEPATMAILGLGAAALLRRKRRSA